MESKENKKLKTLEEAELTVVLFDENDVVVTSDCLTAGTKIAMADGSEKKIEDICEGELVLAFDHEAGCFVGSPVLYAYQGDAPKCAFTLRFSNGAELSIVGEHDLFERESRKYVTISEETAEQFIGKHFYSAADRAYVELLRVTQETEAVDYYEIYTANALNCIANGMLNVADDVDHLLNIYEFNEDLSINKEALAEDIQRHGLFAFSEKYGYTEQEFDSWNMRYIKIAVGKGLISWDELLQQRLEYLAQKDGKGTFQCAS